MTVPSPRFLLFALVAAMLYNLSAAIGWRRLVLLAANLLFLASFGAAPLAFLPFACFLTLGFFAQYACRSGTAPWRFLPLLLLTIAAFVWLKRYSFLPENLFIAYPYVLIGLSYIFFRVLHLIIDRHQGAIAEPIGLLSYLNYTLNFTTLVSGPIQRYEDFHRMERDKLVLDLPVAGKALERIVVGYFKVAIISVALSTLQHQAIVALAEGGTPAIRLQQGVLIAGLYPLYLYFNFSGYTDVVIGVARFFRVELPENFNRPFTSENFIEFWSRWHMTLSGWLKTYVYNPFMLTAMARMPSPALAPYIAVVAFFVTFFLVGLWHGQTSAFIIFGFLQGGGVAANKLWQVTMQQRLGRNDYRRLAANTLYRTCCRGLTFTWFTFTLLWFWSNNAHLLAFGRALGPLPLLLVWFAIFALATLGLALVNAAGNLGAAGARIIGSRYVRTASVTAALVVTVGVIALLNAPAPDIVYKAF